ncbi:dipeptide/oligopeptide/nickel ABC transporter permease/ATP-binding protein [Microbacterium sp. K35]|uniref:dipeptide/oligopeptide/nickel ABC transporter permease/ATP-binding protein n=1 Tax=Microbacterium sp. K35 TaxID=2305440 RepID=UPI00109BA029|nr:dipeptide/oligopeptide/nickel ABC transporter permease/ATP-binding protein [Microbacterium sp. K35]
MRSILTFLRNPLGAISTVMVLVLVFLALFAPEIWGAQANQTDTSALLQGPSAAHPLGTDGLGRDLLLRTVVAARLSLGMALIATVIGLVFGLLLGALPSVLGPRVQRLFSSVISTWLAFPVLLVAMLTVILLGPSSSSAVIALGLTMVPSFARLAQTLSSRVGGSEYLAAARMMGVSRGRQFTRYVLPNIAEPIIVNVTLSIGGGLLALSSLSFLGVGVQPPDYDWGRMLSEAFDQVYTNPTAVVGPGVAVVFAGVAFGTLGESLAAHLRSHGKGSVLSRRKLGSAPRVEARERVADDALLVVDGLSVSFPSPSGWVRPVQDVSFSVAPGEIVGVVGESGSGKSVALMAVAQLSAAGAAVTAQELRFDGDDVLDLPPAVMKKRLGTKIGVVFQDSLTALNPALRVGTQLAEIPRFHARDARGAAHQKAVAALKDVAIDEPERRSRQFPHEYSGGMRQRALIAMSQIGKPRLIIADEPTTALDVTVQQRVLALLRRECEETGAAAIVVSHDIAVLAELCQRILVMYAGRIVEDVDVRLLATPEKLAHPYTRALAESLPDLDTDRTQPLATIPGEPPDLSLPLVGCGFAPRCPFATEQCRAVTPEPVAHGHGGRVACWHPQDGVPIEGILGEPVVLTGSQTTQTTQEVR